MKYYSKLYLEQNYYYGYLNISYLNINTGEVSKKVTESEQLIELNTQVNEVSFLI